MRWNHTIMMGSSHTSSSVQSDTFWRCGSPLRKQAWSASKFSGSQPRTRLLLSYNVELWSRSKRTSWRSFPLVGKSCSAMALRPAPPQTKKKNVIDASMWSQVRGSVRTVVKDNRLKQQPLAKRPETRFEIRSPCLDAKVKKGLELCMVNPFWVVVRCVGSKSVHNMELGIEMVQIPHLDLKGAKKNVRWKRVSRCLCAAMSSLSRKVTSCV